MKAWSIILRYAVLGSLILLGISGPEWTCAAEVSRGGPEKLLPQLSGWAAGGDTQTYLPESLFEYIDGAAESYLGYDFQELAVGFYKRETSPGELTIEVYDMGSPRNAFGIYSTERYPESVFLQVGVQGYREEGSLNFLGGRYYVKLMCYDCGPAGEGVLEEAARRVVEAIADPAGFPAVLAAFPRQDLVANSEKFVLKNFLGQSWLLAGYTAQYRQGPLEYECFIVESGSVEEAETARQRLTDPARTNSQPLEGLEGARHWRDKYLGRMAVVRAGRFLCGLSRWPDSLSSQAAAVLGGMARAVLGLDR